MMETKFIKPDYSKIFITNKELIHSTLDLKNKTILNAKQREFWSYNDIANFFSDDSQFLKNDSKIEELISPLLTNSNIKELKYDNFSKSKNLTCFDLLSLYKVPSNLIDPLFSSYYENNDSIVECTLQNKNPNYFINLNYFQDKIIQINFDNNIESILTILMPSTNNHLSSNNVFLNLANNSNVQINLITDLNSTNNNYTHIFANQNESSLLELNYYNFGVSNLKLNVLTNLLESKAHAKINGMAILTKEQINSTNIFANHYAKESFSNQYILNLLSAQSKSVFKGNIFIDNNCSQVEGQQLNQNILLSNKSKAYSIPSLDVYNDDVKCAHGCSTGSIDPESVFYLVSRGIKDERAKELVLKAKVSGHIANVRDNFTKELLNLLAEEKIKELHND